MNSTKFEDHEIEYLLENTIISIHSGKKKMIIPRGHSKSILMGKSLFKTKKRRDSDELINYEGLINYEEKEIIPLTYEENDSYNNQKVCYICRR